jgi:hypothetical protein
MNFRTLFLSAIPILGLAKTGCCQYEGERKVTIKGRLINSELNDSVDKALIRLWISNEEFQTFSDTSGQFSFDLQFPQGQTGLRIDISAKNHASTDFEIDFFLRNDTVIQRTILLEPSKVCIDNFVPVPIRFAQNSLRPQEEDWSDFQSLKEILKDLQITVFVGYTLRLFAYSGFDETEDWANRRAEMVKEELIKAGFPEAGIRISKEGHADLFHFLHQGGCHYWYLIDQGYALDRATYDSLTNPPDEEWQWRRTVRFRWEE